MTGNPAARDQPDHEEIVAIYVPYQCALGNHDLQGGWCPRCRSVAYYTEEGGDVKHWRWPNGIIQPVPHQPAPPTPKSFLTRLRGLWRVLRGPVEF